MQDVKDKAKAFIKRKVEQLTQEHAAEIEVLRAQLLASQRQHAEAVDAASAADIFRQKQLETEKAKHASELQEDRMRAESALSDAQARFSEALAGAKNAALNVTDADEKFAAALESTRILKDRNDQLERESRQLLQVKRVFL